RGPHFLPVDDEVVAILDRARLQRGQVGARTRLGISLAPDFFGFHYRRDIAPLLLLGPPMQQRRPEKRGAHPEHRRPDASPRQFLVIDDRLQDTGAAPSILNRPVRREPSAFGHLLGPALLLF